MPSATAYGAHGHLIAVSRGFMKPGVEDSSMLVHSSHFPASIALPSRQTTSAIDCFLISHLNTGTQLRRRRQIARCFKYPIDVPTIVLIVTADSVHRSKHEVAHSIDCSGPRADTEDFIRDHARPYVRTASSAICDPVHSIEHRMPLFAYRGSRKRHHQRKEGICTQH